MTWLFSKALMQDFENSRYSPELAEESLVGTCSDGEPSAQLSVMDTPHKFWRKGKMMDACDHSLFGLTSQVLTESHGKELLMWYLAGFPVKTYPVQEKALGSPGSEAAYGATWPGLLAKFDPDSCSWKIAQCSLLGDSELYSGTWPRWGSMRNGVCWERETPAFRTNATVSGSSLPTPSGVNGGNNNTMGRVDEWGGSSNPLRGTVIGSMCLPEFEELVMGWPVSWTALTPFAMDKFQEWQQQHGGF